MSNGFEDRLVSIIVPAYRAAACIEHTLASVRAQTWSEWEMLVADDCSPDDTREIVAAWSARDPRIRLIEMARNGGPAAARNEALAAARGRWLAFLDSDDEWLPRKLERTIAHALRQDSALTFTGFRRISQDGAQVGGYIHVPPTLTYRQLLGNTAIATSTVVLDRQQVGEVRMQRVFYDDFACWLSILKRGFVAHGLDEDLMRYRVMAASVSRNKKRSAHEVWKALRQVEGLGPLTASWHFTRYAVNAARKYRRF